MSGIKSCHRIGLIYTGQVRLNGNCLRLAMLALLMMAVAGCSGINAGGSVSPATFFLPGLMKADPPAGAPAPVAVSAPSPRFALAQ
jgi:hypothetical protein